MMVRTDVRTRESECRRNRDADEYSGIDGAYSGEVRI
jgi:hypothetical protein